MNTLIEHPAAHDGTIFIDKDENARVIAINRAYDREDIKYTHHIVMVTNKLDPGVSPKDKQESLDKNKSKTDESLKDPIFTDIFVNKDGTYTLEQGKLLGRSQVVSSAKDIIPLLQKVKNLLNEHQSRIEAREIQEEKKNQKEIKKIIDQASNNQSNPAEELSQLFV